MSASVGARAPRDERADVSPNGPLVPFGNFFFFFFQRRRRAQKVATLAATNAADPQLRLTR